MVEKPVVEHVGAGQEGGHKAAVLGLQVERSAVEQASQPQKHVPRAQHRWVMDGIRIAQRREELQSKSERPRALAAQARTCS